MKFENLFVIRCIECYFLKCYFVDTERCLKYNFDFYGYRFV